MTTAECNASNPEPTVEQAVEVVIDTLPLADEEQRNQIVDGLKGPLREAGVLTLDLGQPASTDERKGALTGRTREQLMDDLALSSFLRGIRRAKAVKKLGRGEV